MKLMIGFVAGVAVGGYLASQMSEDQRSQVAARTSGAMRQAGDRVKESGVGQAVADNASKVTTAASDRVTGVVDSAGDSVADAVGPDGTATGGTTTVNAGGVAATN